MLCLRRNQKMHKYFSIKNFEKKKMKKKQSKIIVFNKNDKKIAKGGATFQLYVKKIEKDDSFWLIRFFFRIRKYIGKNLEKGRVLM